MPRYTLRGLLVCLLLVVTMAAAAPAQSTLDWAMWRGPQQNGISREVGLPGEWNPKGGAGSNLLWSRPELGSISTPIVMNGRIYLLARSEPETPVEGEKIICADAATGETLWENRFNVFLSDVPAERVGWSSVVGDPETDRVYALGVCCLFQCVDGQTGETIWSRSLSEEFGMLNTYGGRTNFPVIFEDLVIISGVTTGWGETARPAHRMLAFKKSDGTLVWMTSTRLLPEDTTYSTPVLGTFNGEKALVFGAGDGIVYAVQPRTGKILWKFALSRRGLNVTPLIHDNVVYMSHAEENIEGTTMGAVVAIDGTQRGDITQTGELWRADEILAGRSAPVLVDGRLYVVDDSAGLHVFDAKSGEELGRPKKLGTAMRASLVWAENKIYAPTSTGICYILEPQEDGVKILSRVRLGSGEEFQASPVISNGRVYLTSTLAMYCLGSENPSPSAVSIAESTETVSDSQPAQVQIVPAEMLLTPGQHQQLELRVFNAVGQQLEADASQPEWSVSGPATVSSDGTLSVAPGQAHAVGEVTVRVGQLTGRARYRVVPPLPWQFEFSENQVPPTWIGADYRHVARVVDGNPMLVKITTIPKGTRSQSWMGPTNLSNYTVQADVKGSSGEGRLPDMGVIAQRYTLDMMGEHQQLQIRTWPPQLRMAKTIPFQWKADVWYTMKLQATVEGGKAVLRGKVWPRDEQEPAEWTIVAEDSSPNLEGSPGLFGNATNAEVFIDNVQVTPNG